MTREEAVKWLKAIEKKYIHGGDEDFDRLRKEALQMAIKALSNTSNTLNALDVINSGIASTYKATICVEKCHPELNNDTDEVKSSVT